MHTHTQRQQRATTPYNIHPMHLYVFTIWTLFAVECRTDKMTKLPECECAIFSLFLSLTFFYAFVRAHAFILYKNFVLVVWTLACRVFFFPFCLSTSRREESRKSEEKSKNNELQLHVNKQLCTFIIAGISISNSSQVFLPMQNINSTHMSHYTQLYVYHRALNLLVKSSEICFTSTS